MKAKFFSALVALMMLFSASAMAQSEVKGDVNGDGVVNELDITAILAVMKKQQETKYYWYVGWTKPTSLEHLQTLAKETPASHGGSTSNIGPSGYSNKLLTNSTEIKNYVDDNSTETEKAPLYVVIPTGYEIYDVTLQNQPITDTSFTPITEVTIANHEIYTFNSTTRKSSGLEIY